MDVGDATALSIQTMQLAQQVDVAIAKKIMDTTESNAQGLISMMERSVTPNLGGNIDVRV